MDMVAYIDIGSILLNRVIGRCSTSQLDFIHKNKIGNSPRFT